MLPITTTRSTPRALRFPMTSMAKIVGRRQIPKYQATITIAEVKLMEEFETKFK